MSSSVSISRIDSPAEASRRQLGSIRPESITKIVFIVRNESTVTTLTDSDEIAKFHLNNATLEVEHREDYDCLAMTAESGASKGFTSVMVYAKGDPEGFTLVATLNESKNEKFPFGGHFTAGPFKTKEAAEEFAVGFLIGSGLAFEVRSGAIRLHPELDDAQELFSTAGGLLEAFQECLDGLEFFHVFPSLRIPKPAN